MTGQPLTGNCDWTGCNKSGWKLPADRTGQTADEGILNRGSVRANQQAGALGQL